MTKYAYPCIGGPLDGEHATTEDFSGYRLMKCTCGWDRKGKRYPESYISRCPDCGADLYPAGMYKHLSNQYLQYNGSGYRGKTASMIWLHADLANRGKISPRKR